MLPFRRVCIPFHCICIPKRCICVPLCTFPWRLRSISPLRDFPQAPPFTYMQNGNVRFVCQNPLSAVYLQFRENVCEFFAFIVCSGARSLFVFRAFVVRFPPVVQAFTNCTVYVQRYVLRWRLCWTHTERELFNLGCGFWLYTERCWAPHFIENAERH